MSGQKRSQGSLPKQVRADRLSVMRNSDLDRAVGGAAAGNLTPLPGYFKAIRRVCDKYGVLLVLDEIMCGMGRTGKMHAWEWEGEQHKLNKGGITLTKFPRGRARY